MKILVDSSIVDIAAPATYCNFQVNVLNKNTTPVYDAFDISNPDIYIGDINELTPSVIKNIEERPALRVCMVGPDTNPLYSQLKNTIGPVPVIENNGYADILKYGKASYSDDFESDIIAIEDYPINNIEKIYFPMNIRYRIFSSCRIVNHNNYCGLLIDNLKSVALKSSKCSIVNPNNVLNSIISDCFPVTNPENAITEVFTDHSNYLKEQKEIILNSRTNFHLLASIFNQLGLDKESALVLSKSKELL